MDVNVPRLGEGADSGVVATVFVKEGDSINKDDPIVELESEKAVASIPSPAAGKVTGIHVKAGDTVKVGQKLITLSAAEQAGESEAAEPDAQEQPQQPAGQKQPAAQPEASDQTEQPAPARAGAAPLAPPSIRRLARQLGIDLGRVRGSERGGRITMADLKAHIQRLQQLAANQSPAAGGTPSEPGPAAAAVDHAKWGQIARKPMSSLRQVIARRMREAWTRVPHVTQFDEADLTRVSELRRQYADAYEARGGRLTFTPMLLKSLVATLKKHPLFNASLDEAAREIILKEYYNIGIAVDTEAGLIVPVIRDVNRKSALELARELDELARRARDRKISADELKGGTFTVSNQGGIGGGHFTPIVNAPELAILGLGRAAPRPVVRDGRLEPRLMLPLCLSYDHRVIDGADAARFIVDLVRAIEEFAEEELKL
jgi:pyruvate dehydrogenase E2 component (dihydrolipoamide acetyltransferase)